MKATHFKRGLYCKILLDFLIDLCLTFVICIRLSVKRKNNPKGRCFNWMVTK